MERAKELNQVLILRVNKAPDGQPLTMAKISAIKNNKTKDNGKLLYNMDWYENESFFTSESVTLSWALTTKETVKDAAGKNYLDQTKTLIKYLQDEVFKNQAMPKEYQSAIDEFKQQESTLAPLVVSTEENKWKMAAQILEALKITKLLRRTPAEIIYDLAVTADGKLNGQKLLPSAYDWSASRASGGRLVLAGRLVSGGANVNRVGPGLTSSDLGACLSRNPSI